VLPYWQRNYLHRQFLSHHSANALIISHSALFHSLSANPSHRSLFFFFRTASTDFVDCLPIPLSKSIFLKFYFFFFPPFSCWFRGVDKAVLCQLLDARISYRIVFCNGQCAHRPRAPANDVMNIQGSFPVRKRTGTLRIWRVREREPIWGSGGGAPSGVQGIAPGQGVRGA